MASAFIDRLKRSSIVLLVRLRFGSVQMLTQCDMCALYVRYGQLLHCIFVAERACVDDSAVL